MCKSDGNTARSHAIKAHARHENRDFFFHSWWECHHIGWIKLQIYTLYFWEEVRSCILIGNGFRQADVKAFQNTYRLGLNNPFESSVPCESLPEVLRSSNAEHCK